MMLNKQTAAAAMWVGLVGLSPLAAAESAAADKSAYHLFNPTPTELMRDLSDDRPDATESPVTVDAGHYQLEVSFVDYSHNDHEGEQVNAWNIIGFEHQGRPAQQRGPAAYRDSIHGGGVGHERCTQ